MSVTVTTQGGIAHVVLDDPPLNILTRGLMARLRETLATLARDHTLRVLVLSANGRHFSAGASVEEHLPGTVEEMIPEFMETVASLHAFPAPVVVAVHGKCLGGALELALAGDLLVAGEGAVLGVPEIQLGVFPPAACIQLPRLARPGVAAELILTGRPLDAAAALQEGLVRRVVPDDAVLEEAMELARTMSGLSAASLREAKKALRAGMGSAREFRAGAPQRDASGWEAAMESATRIYLEDLMRTEDAGEGLRSFMEKRQPEWSHS